MPPPGPPPFQPSADYLTSLAAEISKSTAEYGSSPSPNGLQKIISATQALNLAATGPMDRLFNLAFQAHINGAIRIAIGMKLFDNLPSDLSQSIPLPALASQCNSTSDFTLRIARALVTNHLIESPSPGAYAHSTVSKLVLTVPTAQALFIHIFDTMTHGMTYFGPYFAEHGYDSPTDAKNSPAAFARGYKDMSFFETLTRDPERLTAFNMGMGATNAIGAHVAATTYPFWELGEEGKTVLVDVGGGRGQALQEIRRTYPDMKGTMVLQDLKYVLDEGTLLGEDEVELCPYNFFEEVQPVEGAKAYFLKSIFHDWPDDSCRTILRNMKPAMRGHDSRLLLCETVLQDEQPIARDALRDINMLVIAGKERSVKQWDDLLQSEHFVIEKIHGLDGRMSAIIEARLKED
ncbi:S-adenosyl-L-methionine-dependent methyltransferase [Viridothelium virens]|uniref:S-adenosyl-L-methionine-dependent methyltransferase n=1 Tax=Viridothelium virens TaxID=1048519 RepID=A0A6A6GSH2_VIRVR|nr:S-adenosyl-L-methionine-dependent methyltransferase [Viridothelium virens]